MAYDVVDLYALDTTPQQNPISGVVVKVLSTNGTIIWGQATTDVNGHVGFLLPAGTYQIRFFKFNVTFQNPLTIVVEDPPGVNTFDVPGTLVTPPVPTDSRLCTAYGFFRKVDGSPAPNTEIHFIAKFDPLWVDGAGILNERIIVRTDETGYVQVNLFQNAQYDCTIAGEEEITRHIDVPPLPNCNIVDLIFPIPASVVFSPEPPFTVSISGGPLALTPTVTASDGENLGLDTDDVSYVSDNPNIFSLQMSTDGKGIVLVGISPGTASILVTRTNLSIVHIPDAGVVGSPQLVTVTT